MKSLPVNLMELILNACFHINIRAAISLLEYLSNLNELEHDFTQISLNGYNLALVDYDFSNNEEKLLVRINELNDYWQLTLTSNGWSIKQVI